MTASQICQAAHSRCWLRPTYFDRMQVLLILNDGPYGTERSYNGLRLALALALAKMPDTKVRVFLMADAVACAKPGQSTPDGYYNVGRMPRD